MDMKHGSDEANMFFTNLSMITSRGKWGDNIMTAEWVHQASYSPAIVIINIHGHDATAENIIESGEFGINMASVEQAGIIAIPGHTSGKTVDKFGVLKELGVEFYKASKIDVQMVKGAVLNLECKVTKHEIVGDHTMFIGEVVAITMASDAKPLVFRAATGFFKTEERIPHVGPAKEKLDALIAKHKKQVVASELA
jgi:flavin reductase (DIM6/NTAB) family NADH-FMN oxidoreductase RutF